jgi:hypothetical protein
MESQRTRQKKSSTRNAFSSFSWKQNKHREWDSYRDTRVLTVGVIVEPPITSYIPLYIMNIKDLMQQIQIHSSHDLYPFLTLVVIFITSLFPFRKSHTNGVSL